MDSKIDRWEYVVLAIVLVAGALLRVNSIGRGLEYDEITTALYFVQQPSIWDTVSKVVEFNNHVGFSVLARLSQSLFPPGEVALRLPALVFGISSLPLVWTVGRRPLGRWGALLATLFLAFNPDHIAYSETARGYTGMVFFALLSTYLAQKSLEKPESRGWTGLTCSNVLGLWMHPYTLFPLSGVLLYLLGESRVDRKLRGPILRTVLGTAIGSFLLYLPTLPGLLNNMRPRPNGVAFTQSFLLVLGDLLGVKHPPALAALLLVLAIAAVTMIRAKPALGVAVFVAAVVPFWIIPQTLLALGVKVYAGTRFFLYFIPYFGLSLGDLIRRAPQKARATGSIVLAILLLVGWRGEWVPEEAPFRITTLKALEILRAHPQALLISNGGGAELYQYYSGAQEILLARPDEEFARRFRSASVIVCIDRQRDWEHPFFGVVRDLLQKEGARVVLETPDRILLLDRRAATNDPAKS